MTSHATASAPATSGNFDTIVLATGNPHKVDEMRAIFARLGLIARIVGLAELPGHERFVEPIEHGTSFEDNARIKALDYCRQTGRACLADDSGIEIDALTREVGGVRVARPGVISSHYASGGVERGLSRAERDQANNQRVLMEMAGLDARERGARFVCVMALAAIEERGEPRVVYMSRGTFEGRIGEPPRVPAGQHGFGYDPVFLVGPDFARTGAELDPAEKSRLSHRALAAEAMATWLAAGAKNQHAPGLR
jgi:XTP/dITP diphosphohydrolase